jgi:tetratricopeptide (TPR) repeat protein
VAKINQVKLRQDADAAERAGRFDKSIDLLRQIITENPRDWNTINRVGDLYAKLNNPKAANEQYVKVARYFADDGFYLKAIAVWKKVLRNDPSMLEGHVSLGDLYAKQGLVAEAKQTFGLVIDECVKRNRLREAGDMLRRMAEVDPADMKVRIRLAELYAREGSQERAAAEYVAIADELVKKGHLAEAMQLIEKALRSGTRSTRLLLAAARVHFVQKDYPKAIGLLEEARRAAPRDRDVALRLAEALLGARRPDQARQVLEGLLKGDPADNDARQQLGLVYLAEGRYDEAFDHLLPAVDKLVAKRQVDRAAGLLQQIVQRNPAHIRSLGKLVELYRQSRNDALVAQTYSQMMEAYLAEGALEQAAGVLEMLVQLDPTNEQHRTKLRWLREQQGISVSPGFEVDLASAAAPAAAARGKARPGQPPALELSGPLTQEDQEFITEHLAEGRVFRKYGLGDKAKDQLEAILSRFPDNLESLRELADLHREKGDKEAAAKRLRVMAEVHRLKGEAAAAEQIEAEAATLAPAPAPAPAAQAPQAAPAPKKAPAAPASPPRPQAPDVGVEITVEEPAAAQQPAPVEDELEYVDLEEAPPEPQAHPAFDAADIAPPGGEITGHFLDEEPVPPQPEGDAFDLGEPPPPPAPPPAVSTAALVPQPVKAKAPGRDVPPELRRAMEEVESYVSMGFVDDARVVLEEVAGRFAGHPFLLRRLADLGLEVPGGAPPAAADDLLPDEPAAPAVEEPLQFGADFLEFTPTTGPAEAPAPPGNGGEGFDLASELGGLFGAQPAVAAEAAAPGGGGTDFADASLQDIFREFQKGVDKQLGKEDYETRYNLGIAYKEMGLVDEAISEFQLAAKDEQRLLECASMLGICFLEKGMPKLAVKWFEKGLSAPGRTEEEYQGLRYDLASALEQAGEGERALALFTELYGQDASFRDVAEKMRQLGG